MPCITLIVSKKKKTQLKSLGVFRVSHPRARGPPNCTSRTVRVVQYDPPIVRNSDLTGIALRCSRPPSVGARGLRIFRQFRRQAPPWRCGAGFNSELLLRARCEFFFSSRQKRAGGPSVAVRGGAQLGVVPTSSMCTFSPRARSELEGPLWR